MSKYKAVWGDDPSPPTVKFRDLEIGDCFLDDTDLCMKIDPVKEGRVERNGVVVVGDDWAGGSVLTFDDDKTVTPVTPKVHW